MMDMDAGAGERDSSALNVTLNNPTLTEMLERMETSLEVRVFKLANLEYFEGRDPSYMTP